MSVFRIAFIGLLVFACAGCQWSYYHQAIQGHRALMNERQPVEEVLAKAHLDERLRQQLKLSQDVLAFADSAIDLQPGNAYRDYVSVQGNAIVWNVMAAPAFSFEPKTWCFPVAGCVTYRGYFDRQRAQEYAETLSEQGWDTHVGGAIAYSTLGWFADPLTSPMTALPEQEFVDLLFHELTHRRVYVKDDTRFNESLATMVAREATLQFYSYREQLPPLSAWRERDEARQRFVQLIREARGDLAEVYTSGLSRADMAVEKARRQQALRDDYNLAREALPAMARYQHFFNGPLNNAQLNGVSDYNQWVPAFQQLFLQCGGQWHCFWTQVNLLADQPRSERQLAMAALLAMAEGDQLSLLN